MGCPSFSGYIHARSGRMRTFAPAGRGTTDISDIAIFNGVNAGGSGSCRYACWGKRRPVEAPARAHGAGWGGVGRYHGASPRWFHRETPAAGLSRFRASIGRYRYCGAFCWQTQPGEKRRERTLYLRMKRIPMSAAGEIGESILQTYEKIPRVIRASQTR
jgi:hypothetical protein